MHEFSEHRDAQVRNHSTAREHYKLYVDQLYRVSEDRGRDKRQDDIGKKMPGASGRYGINHEAGKQGREKAENRKEYHSRERKDKALTVWTDILYERVK